MAHERLVSITEAARYLSMSESSFRRLVKPTIAAFTFGARLVRYRVDDLDAWRDGKESTNAN